MTATKRHQNPCQLQSGQSWWLICPMLRLFVTKRLWLAHFFIRFLFFRASIYVASCVCSILFFCKRYFYTSLRLSGFPQSSSCLLIEKKNASIIDRGCEDSACTFLHLASNHEILLKEAKKQRRSIRNGKKDQIQNRASHVRLAHPIPQRIFNAKNPMHFVGPGFHTVSRHCYIFPLNLWINYTPFISNT